MGWDGMGWDGTGSDGTGRDGTGWDGVGLHLRERVRLLQVRWDGGRAARSKPVARHPSLANVAVERGGGRQGLLQLQLQL